MAQFAQTVTITLSLETLCDVVNYCKQARDAVAIIEIIDNASDCPEIMAAIADGFDTDVAVYILQHYAARGRLATLLAVMPAMALRDVLVGKSPELANVREAIMSDDTLIRKVAMFAAQHNRAPII